jgi:hypothetical protein
VPFAVVHDWHCTVVGPLLVETVARRGGDPAAQEAVRALHERALAGERVVEGTWRVALEEALGDVYRLAYAYQKASAEASRAAAAFALSRGYAEAEAHDYGQLYARLNTQVNARVHEQANAAVNASALAAVFAGADAAGYAATWPAASVRAWVAAWAGEESDAGLLRDEVSRATGAGVGRRPWPRGGLLTSVSLRAVHR